MKKHHYIAPTLYAVTLAHSDAILLTASEDGNTVIEDGGSASDHNISSADVKGQGLYNVWDDDWSLNPE